MSSLRESFAATADSQASSYFFEKLPYEIREKIYDELWQLHETRWHVHALGQHSVPVFPCITHADEEDTRYANFRASRGDEAVDWEARLRSPWNTHWKCEEAAATRLAGPRKKNMSPGDYILFASRYARQLDQGSPLFVCKRMYLEAVERLENVLTFSFTDIIVARNFLAKYSHRTICNIEISLRIKPLFTELYYPAGPDGEPQPHIDGLPVTAKDNPWEDLCRRISALPNLRQLHIYLDSTDLRPWHKRVNERNFLEQLSQARARNYVLYLPDLPDEPELRGLPGRYLESDILEEASFRIKRGPRPNNWQLHLSRVSQRIPENWSHTLWNQVSQRIWPV